MLFGRHGPRIPVGGPADDPADIDDELAAAPAKHKPRDKDVEEPFMFHTVPMALFDELYHAVDAVAVLGLASDGKAAIAALERRIPFFGLSFTPDHSSWLTKRLESQVFKRFQDPQSKLYQAGLSLLLTGPPGTKAIPKPANQPSPKRSADVEGAGNRPTPPKKAKAATAATGSTAQDHLARVRAMAMAATADDAGPTEDE